MKKTTISLIIFFVLKGLLSFSQDYNIQPKQGIESQFGANSPVFSLKYQRFFWLNSQQHFTASAGIGLYHDINFSQDLTYSIGDGRHFWEIGVLGLYSNIGGYEFNLNRYDFRKDYQYLVLPMTGYKYISPKWASARIHFSPYIYDGKFYPYGGVAVGIYFKEKKYVEPKQKINTIRYAIN
jgi:hypothetical protein